MNEQFSDKNVAQGENYRYMNTLVVTEFDLW